MDDGDWRAFYSLLDKIVALNMPWEEKARLVKRKAAELGGEVNLDEFLGWFDDEIA